MSEVKEEMEEKIKYPKTIKEIVEDLRSRGKLDEEKWIMLQKRIVKTRRLWKIFWILIAVVSLIFQWVFVAVLSMLIYVVWNAFENYNNVFLVNLYSNGLKESAKIKSKSVVRGGYTIRYFNEFLEGKTVVPRVHQDDLTMNSNCTVLYDKNNVLENTLFQDKLNKIYNLRKEIVDD